MLSLLWLRTVGVRLHCHWCLLLSLFSLALLQLHLSQVGVRCDWIVSPFYELVKVMPTSEYQYQNPPSFTWNRHASFPPSYVLEITSYRGSGTIGVDLSKPQDQPQQILYTFTTDRNWYLPSKAFPLGTYLWRVRPDPISYTGGIPAWSDERQFTIDGGAMKFEVPEFADLRAYAINKKRPRSLSDDFKSEAQWDAAQTAAMGSALATQVTNVLSRMSSSFPTSEKQFNPASSLTDPAYGMVYTAVYQLVDCALLWRIKGQRIYLVEALKRGDQIASLDPYGNTGYYVQDQFCREIALNLVRGLDLLYDVIDADRRERWLKSAILRTNDLYSDFTDDGSRLEDKPYDSHKSSAVEYMSAIAYLSIGDVDAAEVWFNYCGRYIFHYIAPWGGPEGGYALGTNYGVDAVAIYLEIWPIFVTASGVNVFQKPYNIGFLKEMVYFIPPYALSHVFGDGVGYYIQWDMVRALAQRTAEPEIAWYANQLAYYWFQETGTSFLSAHFPMPYKSVTPKQPENAILLASIGWAAMHSDISDPNRTSVFFHAQPAPYGTWGHAHMNPNAFLLNSNGRQLLIECGWYDSYGSANSAWYRSTKASNAITYDGGIGVDGSGNTVQQYHSSQVTHFSHSNEVDSVAGDATFAYAGTFLHQDWTFGYTMTLTSIIRRLWYLRTENVVLVQDLIKAPTNHSYEWNFHSLTQVTVLNNGTNSSVMFTNVDTSLCITSLTTDAIQYVNRTWPLQPTGPVAQYHGAFIKPNATATEFLMLLDIGCRRPLVNIQDYMYERVVMIGSQSITVRK